MGPVIRSISVLCTAIKSHSKPSKALHRKAPETSSRDKLVRISSYRLFRWFFLVVLSLKKGFPPTYNAFATFRKSFVKGDFPLQLPVFPLKREKRQNDTKTAFCGWFLVMTSSKIEYSSDFQFFFFVFTFSISFQILILRTIEKFFWRSETVEGAFKI